MGAREDLICYLHKQLVGPAGEDHELIEAPPDRRYLMGTLYPQDTNREQRLTESAEVLGASVVSEEISEESRFAAELLPEANDWLPSSLGLSFFTDATKLRLTCRAACYVTLRGDGSRRWRREPLPDACLTAEAGQTELVVFDGRGEIQLRWRPFPGGQLVTVALVNTARSADDEPGAKRETQWDDMLFQVSLEVEPVDGELREYPSVRLTSRDKEEEELRLQYRHVVTYGIGHSCAVEEIRKGDRVAGLRTEVMPEVEVPAIRPAGPTGSPVLKLSHLYDPELSVEQLRAELREFTGGY